MTRWTTTSIGNLATYVNGRAFKPSDWGKAGLPIVRIANLNSHEAVFDYFTGALDDGHRIDTGDIVVSWSATLDAFIWDRGPAALNQHIFKVVPNKQIDKEFLFYALKRAMAGIAGLVHGATMKHVTKPEFEGFKLRVPWEISDQRRIAARLKAQLAAVEQARQAARAQLGDVRHLTTAVLSQAFGSVGGAEPTVLGDVIRIDAAIVDPTKAEVSSLPHINGENIQPLTGELSDVKSAAEDGMTSGKYQFDAGDVLYSKLRPYLRKAAMTDFAGLCSADMYPIKVDVSKLDAQYLRALLVSEEFTEYAIEASARSRMPKLNREQLFSYEFKLPLLATQKRIAIALKNQLAGIERLRAAAQSQLADIEALPARLLAQAFDSDHFGEATEMVTRDADHCEDSLTMVDERNGDHFEDVLDMVRGGGQ